MKVKLNNASFFKNRKSKIDKKCIFNTKSEVFD